MYLSVWSLNTLDCRNRDYMLKAPMLSRYYRNNSVSRSLRLTRSSMCVCVCVYTHRHQVVYIFLSGIIIIAVQRDRLDLSSTHVFSFLSWSLTPRNHFFSSSSILLYHFFFLFLHIFSVYICSTFILTERKVLIKFIRERSTNKSFWKNDKYIF